MEERPLPYHNWRRPLPRPIVIPKVMTLETLEDVRALVHRHPAEYPQQADMAATGVDHHGRGAWSVAGR